MAPQALGPMKRGPMPLPPRGLRSPQFHGMLGHRPQQQIYPWMGALLRPGETVVGASLMGESLMRRAVQRITAPMTYCEVGLWRVPIAALGPDFVQIISNSSDEAYEYFRRSAGQVLGVPDSTDPVGSGGHLSFGLGTDHRAWAGEVGYADADAQGPSSPYARYISEGTYLIGSTWYDLDWFNMAALGSSADLMDSPPSVGPFIRGAGEMALASGLAGVGDVGTRIGDIIEHISLISRPDKSWAETLLDMGTPLSRIGSIPEPLMIKQQLLRSLGSTQYANSGNRRYTGAGFDDYDPEIGSAGSTDERTAWFWRPATERMRMSGGTPPMLAASSLSEPCGTVSAVETCESMSRPCSSVPPSGGQSLTSRSTRPTASMRPWPLRPVTGASRPSSTRVTSSELPNFATLRAPISFPTKPGRPKRPSP